MKQKETPLVLVHYISVDGLTGEEAFKFAKEYQKELTEIANKQNYCILNYIIPVYDQQNRVECINPQLVTDEKYDEAVQVLERLKESIAKLDKKIDNVKNN